MEQQEAAIRPSGTGPRQEYLDAFDAFDHDSHGQAIPAQRRAERAAPPGPGRHAKPARRRAGPGDSRPRRRLGRLLAGLALLAVIAAAGAAIVLREPGQAGGGDVADAERPAAQAGPEDESAPLQARPGEESSEPAAPPAEEEPPSYEEQLGTAFAMDPELTGSGELVPVPGSDPAADPGAVTLVRYRVDVEAGLGVDPAFFAEAIHRTLSDERGWGNAGERTFARVSGGEHDFVITLASPGTTADWCARSNLDITEDNVSCNSSSTERVMINAWRWAQGSETYGDDIAGYRQMLINHEVGHRLGYGHLTCPAEGALAPVMMQQTKFLEMNGLTCLPNPWPHPGA